MTNSGSVTVATTPRPVTVWTATKRVRVVSLNALILYYCTVLSQPPPAAVTTPGWHIHSNADISRSTTPAARRAGPSKH